MSGIAAVFYRDGRPCDRAHLAAMLATIAHRGPDGSDLWCAGPAGLGHVLLATTPEARHEQAPLVSRAGDLVLTADLRLDNRAELMSACGIRPGDGAGDGTGNERSIGDGALVLAAYERWGERCPEHLLGDFAFALWDRRRQTLVCARDHFGVKPLYYYQSGSVFACASEIKALLVLPGVPRQLDETHIADYLVLSLEDTRSTLYQDLQRLAPAYSLTIGRTDAQERRYWALDPTREAPLGSDREYAAAFRDIFTEAVRCRLRAAGPLGSALSGGLDSSSVTCMARDLLARDGRLPLHTFSGLYDDVPASDEREYMRAVVAQGGVEAHYGHPDRLSPLTDWEGDRWREDEPLWNPQIMLHWVLLEQAREQGIHVLLDGFGGDFVVSHGIAYLAELARSGRWLRFYVEAAGLRQHFNVPLKSIAWRNGIRPLVPARIRQVNRWLRGRESIAYQRNIPIRPEFARRIGLDERVARFEGAPDTPPRSSRQEHWEQLTTGIISSGSLSVADRTAALFGVEVRYPFLDRRLAEFCLALPPEQKMRRGWTRLIMRRALHGILPREVQWRPGKANLGHSFNRGLSTVDRPLLDDIILHRPDTMAGYLDMDALRQMYRRYLEHGDNSDGFTLWRVAVIALWLRRTGLMAYADTAVTSGEEGVLT